MTDNAKVTHLPHRNGPACGVHPTPTDARDYDPRNPTCAKCKAINDGAIANTDRIMQRAALAAKASAPGAEPPTTKAGKQPKDD